MTPARPPAQPPSGHVFRVERKRGPVWYAKYRLPDGRQVQKKLGPAWTGRVRPAAGYVTKRQAEAWLDEVLAQARRGELPGMLVTGATVADAAAEWLRYVARRNGRRGARVRRRPADPWTIALRHRSKSALIRAGLRQRRFTIYGHISEGSQCGVPRSCAVRGALRHPDYLALCPSPGPGWWAKLLAEASRGQEVGRSSSSA